MYRLRSSQSVLVLSVSLVLMQCLMAVGEEDKTKTGDGVQKSIDADSETARASKNTKGDGTKAVNVKGWNGSKTDFLPPPLKVSIHSLPEYVVVPKVEAADDTYSWALDPATANGCVKDPASVASCTEQVNNMRITTTEKSFKLTGKCKTAPDTVEITVVKPNEEAVIEKEFHMHEDGAWCGWYKKMQVQRFEGEGAARKAVAVYYGGCHVEERMPHGTWTASKMSIPGTRYAKYDDKPWEFTTIGIRTTTDKDGFWDSDHIYFPEEYFTLRRANGIPGEGVEKLVQHMWIYGKEDLSAPPVDAVEYTHHDIEVHVKTEGENDEYWTIRDGVKLKWTEPK